MKPVPPMISNAATNAAGSDNVGASAAITTKPAAMAAKPAGSSGHSPRASMMRPPRSVVPAFARAAVRGEPLQIEGEVVRVRPIKATPNFEVGVQYRSSGPQREVVEALLSRIGVDPNYELVRRHPRIPVNLVARDGHRPVSYLIRDLSRSGMRIEGRSFADDPIGIGPISHKQLACILYPERSFVNDIFD